MTRRLTELLGWNKKRGKLSQISKGFESAIGQKKERKKETSEGVKQE